MMLSNLFSGVSGHVEDTAGKSSSALRSGRTAEAGRLRSFVPGQMLRGEIVSRNGSEIQLKLSEDMVLNAHVDQSIHLEIGQSVTFEVKSNGAALALSPLFTNVSADINVLKALEMAGLPVNETTVAMTEQLMKAGMPVNRSSLQQIYREINSFPECEASDVISLHRLQLPVNEENVLQAVSYRNLEHQLLKGIADVLEQLPETLDALVQNGDAAGAETLLRQLAELFSEEGTIPLELPETEVQGLPEMPLTESYSEQMPSEDAGQPVSGMPSEHPPVGIPPEDAGQLPATADPGRAEQDGAPASGKTGQLFLGQEQTVRGDSDDVEKGGMTEKLRGLAVEAGLTAEERQESAKQLKNPTVGDRELLEMLSVLRRSSQGASAVRRMFADSSVQKLLTEQLKEQWTLRPEELSQPGKVGELYRRMNRQLRSLLQTLESAGQGESGAAKAITGMTQNLDFMSRINQLYSYVQLPLRLRGSDAHGDLYVYTTGKGMSDAEGKVSALLHLDMEHLGPLDVYLALEAGRLSSKFTVADEEILDFLEAHMEILTERLEKRGYACSVSMTAAGTAQEKEEGGGLAPLLQQTGSVLLSHYAFDVRT